jgi:hypothetical protein
MLSVWRRFEMLSDFQKELPGESMTKGLTYLSRLRNGSD